MVLKELNGETIRYTPGQFLTLVFEKKNIEERRSYSISSTPQLNEPLTITIKRIDNGEYSRFLFDHVQTGHVLHTIGASGFFTLPENPSHYPQYFFLAAGSGITPILPLIKTLLYSKFSVEVTLIYSNRSSENTIFHAEVTELRNRFPYNFRVELLFSSSQDLLRARLTKFFLVQYVHERVSRKDKALFYLCGPFKYMQMATITLLTEGIPKENIRKENFSTEKPVVKELPPDVDRHVVTVSYEDKSYVLDVQYPTTILGAAKQSRIMLPYSCEAGKCGTCAATCLSGNIWHSYNEVLTEKELAKGRILTCTAYPYGEQDVVITYPDRQSK